MLRNPFGEGGKNGADGTVEKLIYFIFIFFIFLVIIIFFLLLLFIFIYLYYVYIIYYLYIIISLFFIPRYQVHHPHLVLILYWCTELFLGSHTNTPIRDSRKKYHCLPRLFSFLSFPWFSLSDSLVLLYKGNLVSTFPSRNSVPHRKTV